MESDKFITVCENNAGVAQVAIVDMVAGNTVTRQKMSAQAAIMNPVSKVIALRGKATTTIIILYSSRYLPFFFLSFILF